MPEDKELLSLKKLGEEIEKAKEKSGGGEKNSPAPASGAMNVSIDLLAGIFVGSFVGYYIDKWLGTLPVFFIVCFFLGIAGAVRNIMREVRNSDKSGEEK